MCIKKKLMAALLTAAMMVSMAMPALASSGVSSPEPQPDKPKNPGWVLATCIDNNLQDHDRKVLVRSYVKDGVVRTQDITHKKKLKPDTWTAVTVARNKDNKRVWINEIGNGTKGICDSQKGNVIKKITIGSPETVTINNKAFANDNFTNSKLEVILIRSDLVVKAGAFKGITNTALKQYLINSANSTSKKKASSYTFESGAFTGLGSSSRYSVDASVMSSTEFTKLKAKLLKAGFPGQITYTHNS